MKISSCVLSLIFIFALVSCKKSSDNNSSLSIEGNYKRGTLHWNNANGTSGSDPNFTFNVASLNPNSIKLTINTTAPIFSKTFTLPLTDKIENAGSGQYTFSTSENTSTYSKTIMIVITTYPTTNNFAQIDYFKTTTSAQDENFDGEGFKE